MKEWRKTLIKPDNSILDAIQVIDKSSVQIALVVDETERLLGTITDGDIRRGIVKGISLESTVQNIMKTEPSTVNKGVPKKEILALMRRKLFRQIPVVDENNRVVGLEILIDFVQKQEKENWIVLMAGGMGTRLGAMTERCPKSLLKVGNKPLLETIIENFVEYGFRKFFFSVNYLAEKIVDYFGDGSQWDVEIQYVKESSRLGTAGALSLLPELPEHPIIVMNGDVLTKINFQHLLDFHTEHEAQATMCIREYDFQVPFGVVTMDRQRILGIDEKPIQRFFVNAGIYVLDPSSLQYVPQNTLFDMPELFEKLIADQKETIVFPIREYWIDIGKLEDLDKANGDFNNVFVANNEKSHDQ
jgi:dTDP-glucose pyrophosphorylase/predicted transcriptional regulator